MAPPDSLSGDRKSGYLDVEENCNFKSRYCILDCQKKILFIFEDNPKDLPVGANPLRTINLRYVSVVRTSISSAPPNKPKGENCFVIEVAGKPTYLRAVDKNAMTSWVNLLNVECRINVPKKRIEPKTSNTSEPPSQYEVTIVGGVPLTTKIQAVEDDVVSSSSESDQEGGFTSQGSFRKYADEQIIKEGYGTKQGMTRKSWKYRYFILDRKGISYFKSQEDSKPIRVITRDLIIEARRSVGIFPSRNFLMEVVTKERVFYIELISESDMWDWINSINEFIGRRGVLTEGPLVDSSSKSNVPACNVQNAGCQTGNSLDRKMVKRFSLPASWCA
ncbi:pleckstrin homology domain-containing family A member 1-like isoform X2 [Tubulanus polymorphus]|uniref:pleckstrin homology domain-containing family A member 1-like isoform X2 n=1 Tax=Tubulanus polymorphus TaxID=672921 RepID=UPI003DA5F486